MDERLYPLFDEHSSLCEKIDALHTYDEEGYEILPRCNWEEYEKLESKRKEVSSKINAITLGEGE